jgi:Fe-S cluster assembly protein SufD
VATYAIDFSGKLTRNSLNIEMAGENVVTLANGIYFAQEDELVDNHVLIDHMKEDGKSSELYRGILSDSSRGVFRGKIMVRPNAQRTDADQNNNCLLLSDDARINTMPQLEIYADDVKCTHGATVGELDDDSIFYLRSRGIGEDVAKNILIKAFIAEVIEKVENKDIKQYIEKLVDGYLSDLIDLD